MTTTTVLRNLEVRPARTGPPPQLPRLLAALRHFWRVYSMITARDWERSAATEARHPTLA